MATKKPGMEITREDKTPETPTVATEPENVNTDTPTPEETPPPKAQDVEPAPTAAVNGVNDAPFNLLIYGNTGVGKTTAAALIKKPIFLLTERQAKVIIERMRVGMKQKIIIIDSMTTFNQEVEKLNAMAHTGRFGLDTWIVLDRKSVV